ncbi:MAG: acriflavine resistance protein B [Alphaproteobacteria bacterium]|nr:acriflavine resistance protein B [Alphaproteobacteria bacterium]
MNLSEICIRRPVATILLSVALVVGGFFAYFQLPVAALPRTDFPTINVSASLPGASPDTMANAVATPLIKQFETIAGVDTISSTSTQGSTSIAIEFDLDRDIDAAAADVQAAIARVQRQLPVEMTTAPSYRKVNPADQPILLLAITSNTLPMTQLDDFAEQVISPALSTLPGVAQVTIYGSQKYAVRIELNAAALTARGIGIDQVSSAVSAAQAHTPVGQIDSRHQSLAIETNTEMSSAAQFRDLIIATKDNHTVRLGDVARVIDSVEDDKRASWYDGDRSIVLAVQRQPDANTVAVVDRVKAMIPTFEERLPPAASIGVLIDRSLSIRAAVDDVQFTLLLTVFLVVLVIFLFLRRASATLIPSLAVPISLIATLGGMYLLGFSIDNISLLGMTLAVGLVVDDAIVMLENIVRHMDEDGLPAFEAALKGSREIGFTIMSITLSLIAVFIPVLLMGGVIGRIFNEFALVVTMAIAASAFVSLTLTPMMCARVLTAADAGQAAQTGFSGFLERAFDGMRNLYDRMLRATLAAKPLIFLLFLGTIAGTVLLFMYVPKGFFPQEDIGQIRVSTQARPDISFDSMIQLQKQVEAVFRRSPYVEHVASIIGAGGGSSSINAGRMFVELKPKDQRPDLDELMSSLRRQLAAIPGINSFMQPIQNLNIGARRSRSQYQFVIQGIDRGALYKWSQKLNDAMEADPIFTDVSSDLENSAIEATVVVDRDKASALGISASQLRSTLYAGFGSSQVASIYATGDSYQVIIRFDQSTDWTVAALDNVRVRAAGGKLVPLSAIAHVERTAGPLSVNQIGQLPAVTISFNLPAGVALGDAVKRIEALKARVGLPTTITTGFSGTAKTFQQSLSNQGLLLTAAVVVIYLVLGILYESFIHPFTILTGLPAAALGALGALALFGMELSVIAMIGILMLIGIVKKNAIMMIDVALTEQRAGAPPEQAIYRACLLRFRPIMMTTFAALMGVLPIALGAGSSAELRQPLGVVVVAGLLVSQLLTLFITPVLYLYMERVSQGLERLVYGAKPQSTRVRVKEREPAE